MNIKQSEIWLVNLNPTLGDEINKIRPCLVVNDNSIGKLNSRTVVPITSWNDIYKSVPWMIEIIPNKKNGLNKQSSIDTFQIRNLSSKRFVKKLGNVDCEMLYSVHLAITKTLSINYRLAI
jgi:mRNA interferase MazF